MFTRGFLAEVRRAALRKRIWWSALDGLERGILTLASQIVDEVKNAALGVELVKIVAKVRDACRSRFARHVDAFGVRRVRVLCGQARAWGDSVEDWVGLGFARYLAFLDLNQPRGWGSGGSAG